MRMPQTYAKGVMYARHNVQVSSYHVSSKDDHWQGLLGGLRILFLSGFFKIKISQSWWMRTGILIISLVLHLVILMLTWISQRVWIRLGLADDFKLEWDWKWNGR
jgi:hypothetical protein